MDHLNQLVRQSVEDTINSLLDAEADAICNATRCQHSPDRLDSRAGSYKQKLSTTLKKRGLKGVKLVISDKAFGLVNVLGDFFLRLNGNAVLFMVQKCF